ncbi:MAG: hypothetical protein IJC56_00025 [Clostridia bacterium]|nr:hypothetical protein [Clostridia bacterium]
MYDMMKGVLNAGRNTLGVPVHRGVRCRKEALCVDQLTLAASDRRNSVRVAPAARHPKALRAACVR